MGNWGSKLEEINEFEAAQRDLQKSEDGKARVSMKERLRTRFLGADPRSATDGMDRTPIAVSKHNPVTTTIDVDTPENVVKTLGMDPRSPGEIARTPIQVEEPVRRRVLAGDECETPVRNSAPTSTQLHTDTRCPLIIENGLESLEAISPIVPIGGANMVLPSSKYDTPKTIDLSSLDTKQENVTAAARPVADRGQPSRILQNRLRTAVDSQILPSCAPAAALDLDDSQISVHSSNDSSLVI